MTTVIADILAMLLEKLGGDISSYVEQVRKIDAARAERLSSAKTSVQPLKDAKSDDAKAIDDAADSALDHI